mmetsp:Transcript_171335/g.549205  ORF Transcript_171335/g.549205 Transcript_171335/m.549205 type:complete len:331 (+) Transcript_171335:572-1564(+)
MQLRPRRREHCIPVRGSILLQIRMARPHLVRTASSEVGMRVVLYSVEAGLRCSESAIPIFSRGLLKRRASVAVEHVLLIHIGVDFWRSAGSPRSGACYVFPARFVHLLQKLPYISQLCPEPTDLRLAFGLHGLGSTPRGLAASSGGLGGGLRGRTARGLAAGSGSFSSGLGSSVGAALRNKIGGLAQQLCPQIRCPVLGGTNFHSSSRRRNRARKSCRMHLAAKFVEGLAEQCHIVGDAAHPLRLVCCVQVEGVDTLGRTLGSRCCSRHRRRLGMPAGGRRWSSVERLSQVAELCRLPALQLRKLCDFLDQAAVAPRRVLAHASVAVAGR